LEKSGNDSEIEENHRQWGKMMNKLEQIILHFLSFAQVALIGSPFKDEKCWKN